MKQSKEVHVLFKKNDPLAVVPTYAKEGDAGMDIYASEDVYIPIGETKLIASGIALAIAPGYFGSLRERSGLALKSVRLGGGVIDSGYRGEIKCILTNASRNGYKVDKGDRIAQLIIQSYITATVQIVEQLPDSERGTSGFGSSGK